MLTRIILIAVTLATCNCTTINRPKYIAAKSTAYTHSESDHRRYGKKTAIGTTLKHDKMVSVACRWDFLPVGTIFKIKELPGKMFIVEDLGGALQQKAPNIVDIYFPSMREMNRWGSRNINITVVKWGDIELTYKLLMARVSRKPSLQKSINAIENKYQFVSL